MTYNLAGYKTGTIEVISRIEERDSAGRTQWLCKCLCGNVFKALTYRLMDSKLSRRQESCGHCQWHIKHKEAYTSWMAMNQRCLDPTRRDYKYYGGRGIKVSSKYAKFTDFWLDVGDPPFSVEDGERMSLDRIDVNGNYEPGNCKWSSRSEQQLNKQ
jgi:hypothetical protein